MKIVIEAFSTKYGSNIVLKVSRANIQDSFHRSTAFPRFCTKYKQRIIHSCDFPRSYKRSSRRSSGKNPFLRFVKASLTTIIERLNRVVGLESSRLKTWSTGGIRYVLFSQYYWDIEA